VSTETIEELDKLAAGAGWTRTDGLTVQGLPAAVWQRGSEIAVFVPPPAGSAGRWQIATYNGGEVQASIANYLVASPPRRTLTAHLEADRSGIIAYLAALQAERLVSSRGAGTQREQRRLKDEAAGLDLAISALQAWEES
jgi:hypothetical protein